MIPVVLKGLRPDQPALLRVTQRSTLRPKFACGSPHHATAASNRSPPLDGRYPIAPFYAAARCTVTTVLQIGPPILSVVPSFAPPTCSSAGAFPRS